MPASSRILSCNHGILSSTSYLPAARFCFPQEAPLFVENRSDSFQAIPHNSKCRYGERGAADAKPKAQIILDAAKVSAASGGNSEPKHDAGTATRHYRAFWQRRCRAAAAGAVLEPLGGNCAVLPSLFPCRYAVCIPVFAHKLPLFTQSLPEFPAISCLVHPQFIFILHDRIYRGPYYRPQLEELLCTKPNSRATPKRRPALYMP